MRTRASILTVAIALAGCGKARSLIPVEVHAPAGASGLKRVELVVSMGASEVAKQSYDWTADPTTVGIYVPSSVEGQVSVRGTAFDGTGVVGTDTRMVDVSPGKKAALVMLHLVPGGTVGDGGAPDGARPPDGAPSSDGGPPADTSMNADRGPDVRPPRRRRGRCARRGGAAHAELEASREHRE
jgi:hypothetical protein